MVKRGNRCACEGTVARDADKLRPLNATLPDTVRGWQMGTHDRRTRWGANVAHRPMRSTAISTKPFGGVNFTIGAPE